MDDLSIAQYVEPLRDASLVIHQGPVTGKACVMQDKSADRKPLDPPPVLHFELDNMDENSEADKTLMSGCKISCVAILEAVNESPEFTKTLGVKDVKKRLWGSTMASPRYMHDSDGTKRHFFCWPDLRVKERGHYRLRFELWCASLDATTAYKVTEVTGDVFEVFAGRRYPGVAASTDLTLCLYRQGFKMKTLDPNRPRKPRKGKANSSGLPGPASEQPSETVNSGPATEQSSPAISPTAAAVQQLAQSTIEASNSVAMTSVQSCNISAPAWTTDSMPIRNGPMIGSRSASPFPGVAYYNMPAPHAGHQPMPAQQYGAGVSDFSFGMAGHSAAASVLQGGAMQLGAQGTNYHLGGGNSFVNPADLQYSAIAPRVMSPPNFIPTGYNGLALHHMFTSAPEMPSGYMPERGINGEIDFTGISTQNMQVIPTVANSNTEPAQQFHDMSEFVFDTCTALDL